MAIVRTMLAVVYPQSGAPDAASPAIPFSDEAIEWPSLETNTSPNYGSAYTNFTYRNANGTTSPCIVKLAKSHVLTTFSVLAGS